MVAMRHVQIGLCLLSGARCSLGGDEEEEQHLWSVDIGGGGGEGIADPSYGLCNAEATDAWIAPTVLRTLFLVQVEPMISCQLVDPEPYLQHSHCLTWLGLIPRMREVESKAFLVPGGATKAGDGPLGPAVAGSATCNTGLLAAQFMGRGVYIQTNPDASQPGHQQCPGPKHRHPS